MSAVIQQTTIDLPRQSATVDERAPRWGFLAGGPERVVLEGIGRMYVGHGFMERRELIPFMPFIAGGRNESASLLEQDYRLPAFQATYDPDPGAPGRFSTLANVTDWKWPLESARDVESTYKVKGFGVLESLTGLDSAESLYTVEGGQIKTLFHQSEAAKRFNTLLPDLKKRDEQGNLLVGSLMDFIGYLREVRGIAQREGLTRTWDELSEAANRCRTHYAEFIARRKSEIDEARQNRGGRIWLDEVEIEIFRELHEPLPDERAALANAHMGREIAEGLAQNASGGNDAMAAALMKLAENQGKILEHLTKDKRSTKPATDKGDK